jgi:hypothetical protein
MRDVCERERKMKEKIFYTSRTLFTGQILCPQIRTLIVAVVVISHEL